MSKLFSLLGLPLSLGLLRKALYTPKAIERIEPANPLFCENTIEEKFSVLSWNIQFAASRKHHFFYDGGRKVHVPKKDVQETIKAISDFITTINPNICALQEVDRNSKRTLKAG